MTEPAPADVTRLVDLLIEGNGGPEPRTGGATHIARYLLTHGVQLPPKPAPAWVLVEDGQYDVDGTTVDCIYNPTAAITLVGHGAGSNRAALQAIAETLNAAQDQP